MILILQKEKVNNLKDDDFILNNLLRNLFSLQYDFIKIYLIFPHVKLKLFFHDNRQKYSFILLIYWQWLSKSQGH